MSLEPKPGPPVGTHRVDVSVEVYSDPWVISEKGVNERTPASVSEEAKTFVDIARKSLATTSWDGHAAMYTAASRKEIKKNRDWDDRRMEFEFNRKSHQARKEPAYTSTFFTCVVATSSERGHEEASAWMHRVHSTFVLPVEQAPGFPVSHVDTLRKEEGRWALDQFPNKEWNSVPMKLMRIPPGELLARLEELRPLIAKEFNTGPEHVRFTVRGQTKE